MAGILLVAAGTAILLSADLQRFGLSLVAVWKNRPPNSSWAGKIRIGAWELTLGGLVALLAGWLVVPRLVSLDAFGQSRRRLALAGAAAVFLAWLPIVLWCRGGPLGGTWYWWLYDDGMISMHYARNLIEGHGLVWNPGERIEGYTNLLWILVMALVHLIGLPDAKTALAMLFVNLVLAAATVPFLIRLVRGLGGGGMASLGVVTAFVVGRDHFFWATAGMETVLQALLLSIAACLLLEESARSRPRPWTYLLLGLLSLVRSDALVLVALLCAVALWTTPARGRVLRLAPLALVLPATQQVFRMLYYGEILPNTAYLKTANWSGMHAAGLRYVLEFAVSYFPLLVLAAIGAWRLRDRFLRGLLFVVMVYLIYVGWVGGDAFENFRFLVPVVPLLTVLAFRGVESLSVAAPAACALGTLCLLPLMIPGIVATVRRNETNLENIRIGLLVRRNTEPGCKVADFYAGSVIYFSHRYGIDLLGKTDRHVARLPAFPGASKPGHNKFDFEHSLGRLKPDLVVANFRLPDDLPNLEERSQGDLAFTGQLFLDPVFQEHCLPYPVPVETWRTIFACDWSPEAVRRGSWRGIGGEPAVPTPTDPRAGPERSSGPVGREGGTVVPGTVSGGGSGWRGTWTGMGRAGGGGQGVSSAGPNGSPRAGSFPAGASIRR